MCTQFYPDDPRSLESVDKHRDAWGSLSGNAPEQLAKSLSSAGYSQSDLQYMSSLSGNEAALVAGHMGS